MRRLLLLAALLSPLPGTAHELFVSNERDNTVSVIDTRTLEVTRSFRVGRRPRGVLLSPDGARLFVCASEPDAVQVVDPVTGKLLHDLPSGRDPEQFALSPDGKRLWIANEDDAVTTVVDIDHRTVAGQIDVGVEPEGMAVSPDGRLTVVTAETSNMAHLIDTETLQVVANIPVGERPRHAEFTADGARLWISAEIGGTVTVIDMARREPVATIGFEIRGVPADQVQPVGMKLTRDGSLAFVALGPANRVAIVDARSFVVLGYLLVGRRVWHLAMTPEEDLLFTTNGGSGDVSVIDVKARRVNKSIKIGEA